MTVSQRLIDVAIETGKRAFDPRTLLTYNSTRETIWWSVGLLASPNSDDVALANRILEHFPELRESGHTMAPLGFIYYHYADRLSPDARRKIGQVFRGALPALAKHQYHYGNVNHPLTSFAGVVFAGDILKQPDLSAYGHALLEQFLWKIDWQKDDDRAMSALSEYNSPTYTANNLYGVHCLAVHAQNPATRDLARRIEEKFWLDLALFYHHPTSSLCGPHSRSYQEGCFGAGSIIDGFIWKVGGGSTFLDFDLMDYTHHAFDYLLWALAAMFDFCVPDQAREIMFHKRFPYEVHANAFCGEWQDGQTVIADSETRYTKTGESYPGDYQHLSSYQTANACLACADRMFADGGHNNSFMLRWRRTERVEKRADIRTIYTRYLVDDQLYGTTYKLGALDDRDWDGMLRIMDNGRAHILHHRQKAIVLYCAKRREWEGRTRLRLGIHISEFAPLDGIWLEEEPLGTLPLDFDCSRTVYLQDGPLFVALRPLQPADFGRRTPCRIERIKDHLLLSIYNYEGPRASWDRDTMQLMHNGFVVEFGERGQFDSLVRFRDYIREARLSQRVVSYGIREVGYDSGGDRLLLRYDALREKILEATANGRSSIPRYLDVTMEGRHDPKFCPDRIW